MHKIKTKRIKYAYYVILIISVTLLVITNSEFMNKPMQIESMKIAEISPTKISKGNKFNLFGDKSVIVINGIGFLSDSKLYVNNTALETAYGNEGYITAILPDKFYDRERVLKLQLRRENTNENSINISNEIEVSVVDIKNEVQDMNITQTNPQSVIKNQKFNIFNGQSALGLTGQKFISGCKIYANDLELNTSFGNENFITAILPNEIYAREGDIKIRVRYLDMENEIIHVSNEVIIPVK